MGVYLYPSNTETPLKNAYIGIPDPTSIVLDKSSISLTTVGQTAQLTATIEPEVSDKTITWTTSDPTIATVSTTGLVTCVTPGTCTITATTVNGLTASCSVSAGRLPSAYQEVEYIQTTGGQYIKTGYIPQSGDAAEIKFNFLTQTGDEQWILAVWQNPNGYRAGADSYGSSWKTNFGFSYDTTGLNTDIIATGSCTHTFSREVFLFAQNENGTAYHLNKGTMRLYYCTLSRSGTPVRDLVPCYRKADTEIGLYDLVNDVFYTNSGTGTFTKGPDVN